MSLLCNKKLLKNNFTVQDILHMLRQYINTMNWMIEVQVFTESAPRVIQSISCDVHLLSGSILHGLTLNLLSDIG